MHHIHHTPALIFSARNSGEADRIFTLYTRELGLLRARASGVRKISSKLRYTLQEFSILNADLVRGKDAWRITSAMPMKSFLKDGDMGAPRFSATHQIIARISSLISRLANGEHAHPEIFDDLVRGFDSLHGATKEAQESIELLLVLRVLHELGYIGNQESLKEYLARDFDPSSLSTSILPRKNMLFEINRALRESQM